MYQTDTNGKMVHTSRIIVQNPQNGKCRGSRTHASRALQHWIRHVDTQKCVVYESWAHMTYRMNEAFTGIDWFHVCSVQDAGGTVVKQWLRIDAMYLQHMVVQLKVEHRALNGINWLGNARLRNRSGHCTNVTGFTTSPQCSPMAKDWLCAIMRHLQKAKVDHTITQGQQD